MQKPNSVIYVPEEVQFLPSARGEGGGGDPLEKTQWQGTGCKVITQPAGGKGRVEEVEGVVFLREGADFFRRGRV